MATPADWVANPRYQQARASLRPVLAPAAQQYGVPLSLLEYVSGVESRFGTASGLDTPGAAGELGFLQQTPAFREDYDVTDPFDRQAAADAAAQALSRYADRAGGDWGAALVGYNRGMGGLNHYLENERNLGTQPDITANYVRGWDAFRDAIGGGEGSLGSYSRPVSRALEDNGLPTQVPTGTAPSRLSDSLRPAPVPTPQGPESEAAPFGGLLFEGDVSRGEVGRDRPLSVAQVDAALRRIENA